MTLTADRHLTALTDAPDTLSQPGPAWPALLVEFAAELRRRGSTPASLAGRLGHLRRLGREHAATPPGSLTAAELTAFLTRPAWGYQTRKAHRASLVDLFGWAHRTGRMTVNPAAGLPRARDLMRLHTEHDSAVRVDLTPETRRLVETLPEHPARAWARAVGIPHAGTGRLPLDVVRCWHAAGAPVPVGNGEATDQRWAGLLAAYVAELTARGLRPATIRERRTQLRRFIGQHPDEPTAVTRAGLVDYLADPSWAPETRRSYRAALVSLFGWAHETGHLPSNPAERLPSVRIPGGVPQPAPETVIRDAINGARPDVRLMILLGSLAGLRRAEIATLHTDAITPDGLRIVGKAGKSRMIPLHPSLVDELDAYRQARGLDEARGYLFTPRGSTEPYTTNHVGVLVSRRMPPGWSAHKLRHRFASRSYAGQYNLRAVQELLGHASPTVTARYVAIPDVAARDAVLAVPPIPGIEAPDPTRPDRRPAARHTRP